MKNAEGTFLHGQLSNLSFCFDVVGFQCGTYGLLGLVTGFDDQNSGREVLKVA